MLAGAALFAAALALSGRPDARFPWHELPLHLLLVQNWGFTDRLSWNDPAWSISCEWAAYLLFPLLALSIDWRRLHTASLLLVVAGLGVLLHLVMIAGGAEIMDNHITRLGLFRALFEFSLGTVLCALWMRWQSRPLLPLAASAALFLTLSAIGLAGWAPETLLVPPLFASLLMMVALTASHAANPLGWRPIHYLGEISYATYLLHFLLFIVFKLLFVSEPGDIPLPLLAAYLLMTLLGSVLLHHLLERPAQRLLNRSFDLWLSRRAGVAAE
jgi:peptidoglycan/LPS O-acetylase OafA/YrhL